MNGSADALQDSVEILVTGPCPIVERGRLAAAVARGGEWLVISDASGSFPEGVVPDGGILVTTREVSDAVKVTEDGRVRGALDRAGLCEVVVPVRVALGLVGEVLATWADDPVDMVARVFDMGGVVAEARSPA